MDKLASTIGLGLFEADVSIKDWVYSGCTAVIFQNLWAEDALSNPSIYTCFQ